MIQSYTSVRETQTTAIGKEFAEFLKHGDIVGFNGDLGAGKTEFVRGICQYFKVEDIVTSPTFSIFNHYSGKFQGRAIDILHIDLYRIENPKELDEIGFDELVYQKQSIKLIEWYEKADEKLPKIQYYISIKNDEDDINKRYITISNNKE